MDSNVDKWKANTSYLSTELCYQCNSKPDGIYVRRLIDGRWKTVAICDACWNEQEPNRTPVRVVEPQAYW